MNNLNTDITNQFFQGYANEVDEIFDFQEKIESIIMRCGNRLEASELTEQLKKEGLEPNALTPYQLRVIDRTFDCI